MFTFAPERHEIEHIIVWTVADVAPRHGQATRARITTASRRVTYVSYDKQHTNKMATANKLSYL